MHGTRRRTCCLALLGALSAVGVAQAAPLSIADAFTAPTLRSMQLSPDGRLLLALGLSRNVDAALVIDPDTLATKVLRIAPTWNTLRLTARWISDDAIALSGANQTLIVDTSGNMVRTVHGMFMRRVQDGADGHQRILLYDGSQIDRVDLKTGDRTRVNFRWPGRVFRWVFDQDGVPRVATTVSTAFLSDDTTVTHWYRKSLDDPWQPLEAAALFSETWQPLHFARDGRSLIVLSARDRNTRAVFRYSIEEHRLGEMMAGHPAEDISSLDSTRADDDEGGIGGDETFGRVVTSGMKTETYWFDPEWEALQKSVDAAVPDRINWLSGRRASGRVLVLSSGDVDPGTWFVLDIKTKRLKEVGSYLPGIDPSTMRPMRIVSYVSPDGVRVPAYLTLPEGSAKALPAIVLIHGGPIARDEWTWNAEVQMLASRGFAVLQPQFRGSAGFGKNYEIAGYGQWGRGMQDDVSAGAKWLVAEGIADPERMCIVGGSYGGYAAMWALVKTPDLFRCGVSIAGVSDLALMARDDSDVNDSAVGRSFRRLTVGDLKSDPHRFDDVSPLLHASEVKVPVLVAHGDRDGRVPIEHGEKLVAALKAAGKPVEWMKLDGEGHGIGKPENLQRYYRALFAFLGKHTRTPMPVEPEPPPSK